MYQEITDLNFAWVINNFERDLEVTLVIEFVDTFANLWSIAAGAYDKYLLPFGLAARAYGKPFTVRMLHEGNGNWYNWGIYMAGNSVEAFKAAWIHVVGVLRGTGAPLTYELSLNNKNPNANPTPLSTFYPGDQWVDVVCVSSYNRCGTDRWHLTQENFATVFGLAYKQIIKFTNKPVCVGEVSTTSMCGDKAAWITDAWNILTTEYTQVQNVYWFLENKPPFDWDLNTAAVETAWINGFNKFKAITKPVGDELPTEEA